MNFSITMNEFSCEQKSSVYWFSIPLQTRDSFLFIVNSWFKNDSIVFQSRSFIVECRWTMLRDSRENFLFFIEYRVTKLLKNPAKRGFWKKSWLEFFIGRRFESRSLSCFSKLNAICSAESEFRVALTLQFDKVSSFLFHPDLKSKHAKQKKNFILENIKLIYQTFNKFSLFFYFKPRFQWFLESFSFKVQVVSLTQIVWIYTFSPLVTFSSYATRMKGRKRRGRRSWLDVNFSFSCSTLKNNNKIKTFMLQHENFNSFSRLPMNNFHTESTTKSAKERKNKLFFYVSLIEIAIIAAAIN